ncbi:hypothetical protein [Parabacteroides goldsteinii]|jgi:hypothetical protein|uniref:hypothetical protein n=1 Tax=Parabacteroides goldsteinii TaxID=328812 RepID=UPI001D4551E1|nr:hypothetical protein [Parabacteroides goldsteinii]MBS6574754.1 hypothetical protein [Parabacteroides goldsteinii]
MEKNYSNNINNQRIIGEAIRKIALGRSLERIDMSPGGIGGIGTARMVHGYVCKIHDSPKDEEFKFYAGTIDVREYPDETASSESITHKGVLLSGAKDNNGGFLILPTLFSDVTIIIDAATRNSYVMNFSHANVIQINSHTAVNIGVTETDDLNPEDENAPDYDKLEHTGNETSTQYTANTVITYAKDKKGKKASIDIEPEKITQNVDNSNINQTAEKVEQNVNGTSVIVSDKKITIGSEDATEPLVLGNQLAQLMLEFLTECSKITTPTLMGTMPAINIPNFTSLTSKIKTFLSKTTYTK